MYISETANPSSRGGLNIMFQLATTMGILIASGINYGKQAAQPERVAVRIYRRGASSTAGVIARGCYSGKLARVVVCKAALVCKAAWHSSAGVQDYEWGWRFSLGFACVFAVLFFIGTLIAPDSPNSLLLNGKTEKATQVSPASVCMPHSHAFTSHNTLAVPAMGCVCMRILKGPSAALQYVLHALCSGLVLSGVRVVLQVLQKIRGVSTADKALQAELDDIQKAVTQTQSEQTSIFSGLASLTRRYPQILFASVIIPIAQQFTGMNAIMFVSAAGPTEPVTLVLLHYTAICLLSFCSAPCPSPQPYYAE